MEINRHATQIHEKKTALVTGASSGMGLQTALALAKRGVFTVMLCRNRERGGIALDHVRRQTGDNAALMICDLADMADIRRFCAEFRRTYGGPDILINNAGVLSFRRQDTADGLELHFGVCHVGHFLLTNLLHPQMSGGSRIVVVGSVAHKIGDIDFDDVGMIRHYNIIKAYSRAKLCNMLFMAAQARRLDGAGISVNCAHPGAVITNIAASERRSADKVSTVRAVAGAVLRPFAKTAAEGSATAVYLATSEAVSCITGGYFADCRPATPSKLSQNPELAERLWRLSEEITGQAFDVTPSASLTPRGGSTQGR